MGDAPKCLLCGTAPPDRRWRSMRAAVPICSVKCLSELEAAKRQLGMPEAHKTPSVEAQHMAAAHALLMRDEAALRVQLTEANLRADNADEAFAGERRIRMECMAERDEAREALRKVTEEQDELDRTNAEIMGPGAITPKNH